MSTRVLFFGTPLFAQQILTELDTNPEIKLTGLVTAPDKPVGRKQVLTPSPVKTYGNQHNIPVYTPDRVNSDAFLETLSEISCDVAVVAAYGAILSSKLLDTLDRRVVNVHPSLLPQYRGPAPIQYTLLNGEDTTGVTLIEMDEKMDHGPMLAQEVISVTNQETIEDLEPKLATASADMLNTHLPSYVTGNAPLTPQNHDQATFTSFITKQHGQIDWNAPATDIYNQYRALKRWPGVYTYTSSDLKIQLDELAVSDQNDLTPGRLSLDDSTLRVGTSEGSILISRLKPAGKQWMEAQTFANGYGVDKFI